MGEIAARLKSFNSCNIGLSFFLAWSYMTVFTSSVYTGEGDPFGIERLWMVSAAAQVVAADAAKKAEALGMKEVEVRINGPGAGRESAVRGIASVGMEINAIKDITPVPHNGCRPPKRRRV